MFRGLRPDEIEVRVGTVGAKGASMLLYKDARCDMNILDETFGFYGWQRDHKELKGNLYAGVGVWSETLNQWVWKWDCGTESNTEKEKGEASDSFKRACFNLGIGRELYTAGFIFIPCETIDAGNGKYKLKDQFQFYGVKVTDVKYKDMENKREIISITICDKRGNKIFQTQGQTKIDTQADMPEEERIDPNKKIEAVHITYIKNKLKSLGKDEEAFLTYMEISSLEDMTIEQFALKAKPALEKVVKK